MKLLAISSLLFSFASCVAISESSPLSYDGWKVLRVKTGHTHGIQDKLLSSSSVVWSHDTSKHIDLAISPDQLDAFERLGLEYDCMHEDLGAQSPQNQLTSQADG